MTNKKQQNSNQSEKDFVENKQVEINQDEKVVQEKNKSESEFDQLKRENNELLDKYRTALAEVENIRKRSVNDLLNNTMFANQKLLLEIIEILSFFDMAMGYSKNQENSGDNNFLAGIKMIYGKLNEILKSNKVIEIETKIGQELDSKKHCSIDQIESDEYKPNQIIKIVEKGYMLHDRVIKEVKVIVCKSKIEKELDTNNKN